LRRFVLDASVTLAWYFEDEAGAESVLDLVGAGGALAPLDIL
jgi:hypothetical protein